MKTEHSETGLLPEVHVRRTETDQDRSPRRRPPRNPRASRAARETDRRTGAGLAEMPAIRRDALRYTAAPQSAGPARLALPTRHATARRRAVPHRRDAAAADADPPASLN